MHNQHSLCVVRSYEWRDRAQMNETAARQTGGQDAPSVDRTSHTSAAIRILSICAATLFPVAGVVIPTGLLTDPAHAQSDGQLSSEADRALALQRSGRCQEAIEQANRVYDRLVSRFTDNKFIWLLDVMGNCQQQLGHFSEAESLHRRALAIRERLLGPNGFDVATSLHNLAITLLKQNRFAEVETLLRRELDIRENLIARRPDPAQINIFMDTSKALANEYASRTRIRDEAAIIERQLAIYEKVQGPRHPNVATTLSELGELNEIMGRYGDAAAQHQRALSILERPSATDPDPARRGQTLGGAVASLASLYFTLGRYDDAQSLYLRALAIHEKALGLEHESGAVDLDSLGQLYTETSRFAEAEPLYRRAVSILERRDARGLLPGVLVNLGKLYLLTGRIAAAEPLLVRAVALSEKRFGPDSTNAARDISKLAELRRMSGRYSDAESLYRRALADLDRLLGEGHEWSDDVRDGLTQLYVVTGRIEQALQLSRKSIRIVTERLTKYADSSSRKELATVRPQFETALLVLRISLQSGNTENASEAFDIAQWAGQSAAADALGQLGARLGLGSDFLANTVRNQQDASGERRALDKLLVAELASDLGKAARREVIVQRIAELDDQLSQLDQRLRAQVPAYSDLTKLGPLPVTSVQELIGLDEALVFLSSGERELQLFAVTRETFEWKTIAIGEKDLSEKVAAFRRGLDVNEFARSVRAGTPVLFDLGGTHDLYTTLLAPLEPLIKDKRRLLVVTSGSLTALPFHLLVTEQPANAKPDVKDTAAYRDAAWLIKRHALTVLPSVASLKALRGAGAGNAAAPKPFIGFGDPVFQIDTAPPAAPTTRKAAPPPRAKDARGGPARPAPGAIETAARTRAYSDYWRGGEIDRSKLSSALPRLEETADELRAIAQQLGAPASDIYLRADASETTVKRLPLADYRVVHFATHGLVAGDVKGLAEPSLALTIPREPSDLDDGLLTASEVAQLKLNADFVVLSACNTMAGDKPGAEALSGLARAFFYAGARALLVSHWAVDSDAAKTLTTATFDAMKTNADIGRAEALRRAMLTSMNQTSNPLAPYPAYWGPFSIIGEGAGP